MTCLAEGCEKIAKVKGLCSAHYQRLNRYGSLELRGRGARPKHGMKNSRTYKSWTHMKYRCLNPNCKKYKDYGGRGIKVCDRWMDFQLFFEDMGERPEGMTLDRIDVNGHYEPGNCRWANNKDQSNNKRKNDVIDYLGASMNLSQWADALGIPRTTLYNRIYTLGWPVDRALGGRAFVAAKLGDTVSVPAELLETKK